MTNKHPDKALTALAVRSITKPGRYADGGGLYLVVDSSGAKRWLLRTVVHGKRRDIGLGGLRTTSLKKARSDALRLREIARSGGDPLAMRRQEKRQIPTFREAARTVHEEHSKAWRNTKHQAQWINTLSQYAFPVLGDKPVNTIDSADVLKTLSPIWLSKPETARRVRQRIKVVFDYAKAAGYRTDDNPVEGVGKVLPKQPATLKHHAALPYTEISSFLRKLHKSNTAEAVKLALEFLILTASRTSEVIGAKWGEIDWQAKTWTVPADRMKAKRPHRVPLSKRCIEILKSAETLSDGGDYIFPGRLHQQLSNMAFLMALRRLNYDVTAHGFRSTFRDFAAERTNYPREVCEAALAHTLRDKTEAAYNRTDLFEKRRKLMETWATFAAASGKVVSMKRKRA